MHIVILLMMAFADSTEVHKQEVWTVLTAWGHTRKKRAIVPGRARPHERLAHRQVFLSLYIQGREDMVRTGHQLPPHLTAPSGSLWMRRR